MNAVFADESLTIVFCSACNQAGHAFDSHIVAGIVWSFNQEQVDVMSTVTFLTNVQRNVAAVVTAAEYVDAYCQG